jgi:hypothetical protein
LFFVTTGMKFTITSTLNASPDQVHNDITSMDGVNRELSPLLRMTVNDSRLKNGILPEFDEDSPQFLFSSWILLFGCIPIDLHFLHMNKNVRGKGFVENSNSLLNKKWQHIRVIKKTDNGCKLTDRIEYTPRAFVYCLTCVFGVLLITFFIRFIFWNRHRNLMNYYNSK